MKNMLAVGDIHAGHYTGLTPPGWWFNKIPHADLAFLQRKNKIHDYQKSVWEWFKGELKAMGKIDICICNGDAIDGMGKKSGGSEQITTDMNQQVQMAKVVLEEIDAKKYIFTYGTGYHTGDVSDAEDLLAEYFKAKIGAHEWVDIEGVIFDIKHHIGSSGIPYGRHTAIAKEKLWNHLWNEHEEQPRADVILRSHVHYHSYSGGTNWMGMTLPALQGYGSKYGARRCNGKVDLGMVNFKVNKGEYSWKAHIARLPEQKAQIVKL